MLIVIPGDPFDESHTVKVSAAVGLIFSLPASTWQLLKTLICPLRYRRVARRGDLSS